MTRRAVGYWRTYRGWSIDRSAGVDAPWLAVRSGECRLRADTLAGLLTMIRDRSTGR